MRAFKIHIGSQFVFPVNLTLETTMSQFTQKSLCLAATGFALSLSVVLPATAGTLSYSGDTTHAPMFHRPKAQGFEGIEDPSKSLSDVGTAVSYFSQAFSVDTAGSYDVTGSQAFDGVQFLYQNSFDPLSPITHLISGKDSFPDVGNSGFSGLSLMDNTTYFLVTAGYDNSDDPTNISYGKFTNTIAGAGNITLKDSTPVPEPSTTAGTIVFGLIVAGRQILKRKPRLLPAPVSESK